MQLVNQTPCFSSKTHSRPHSSGNQRVRHRKPRTAVGRRCGEATHSQPTGCTGHAELGPSLTTAEQQLNWRSLNNTRSYSRVRLREHTFHRHSRVIPKVSRMWMARSRPFLHERRSPQRLSPQASSRSPKPPSFAHQILTWLRSPVHTRHHAEPGTGSREQRTCSTGL